MVSKHSDQKSQDNCAALRAASSKGFGRMYTQVTTRVAGPLLVTLKKYVDAATYKQPSHPVSYIEF